MRTRYIYLFLILVTSLAACQNINNTTETIEGSGSRTTVERDAGGFSKIEINLGADLTLNQGDVESLTIEADDNLMEYIISEVKSGILVIRARDKTSLNSPDGIKLIIGFEDLSAVTINGRSNVSAENVDLETLDITFSGGGSTQISGTVETQTIDISGNATIHNEDLSSQVTTIEIKGMATVRVDVEDTLDVKIAGQGTIFYEGDPRVTQEIEGAGSVQHAS